MDGVDGARVRFAGGTLAGGTLAGGALLLSMAAHGARFLAYAVLLVLLARLWPPETFGLFAWHNAAASILGLAAGWGLSLKVTRDAALAPGRSADVLRSALAAQTCLAPFIAVIACGLWLAGLPMALELVLPLAGAFICLNLAETVAATCRGVGRFDADALLSLAGNGIFFVGGLGAAIIWQTPVAVGAALLAGRAVHAGIALWAAHRLGLTASAARPEPAATLRSGAVFAAESFAAGLFLQVDTVLVALLLGEAAAGVYQAGIRFIVIALVFAQSMAGLFLPALATRLADPPAFAETGRRAVVAFAGYGLVGFALLLLWGDEIAMLLYGGGYEATAGLAPLFGALVLMRCVAAGAAVVLTAAGEQVWRLCATLAALAAYLGFAFTFGAEHGVGGMAAANLASLALLALLYLFKAAPRLGPRVRGGA